MSENHAYNVALTRAWIICNAAAKLSGTHCDVFSVIPMNKGDAFWLRIAIGISPHNVNQLVWDRVVGGTRERHYAHLFRIRVPFLSDDAELGEDEKLRQIGRALADIWDESRYLPIPRADRKYIIPHIEQMVWGTETIPTDATQKIERK